MFCSKIYSPFRFSSLLNSEWLGNSCFKNIRSLKIGMYAKRLQMSQTYVTVEIYFFVFGCMKYLSNFCVRLYLVFVI
jgi:hypothetical protein